MEEGNPFLRDRAHRYLGPLLPGCAWRIFTFFLGFVIVRILLEAIK